MSALPTGTVTLLLADVEGSTRLWKTQADAMKVAVERLDQTLSDAVAGHPLPVRSQIPRGATMRAVGPGHGAPSNT
jgi:class 3 adenylate cyclase